MRSVVAERPISDVTLSRAQVRDCRTLCCALILGAALLLPACEEGSTTPPAPTAPAPTPPPPAPQPPTAPANLRVSAAEEDFVEWSWNAVAGATGYEVQFSRDAEFTEADEVIDVSGQTVYRREGLSAETSVYLRVRSYRETGDDRLRGGWTVVLPATTLVPAIPETIPDAGLRAAVTVALGKRAGDPVTRGEFSTLGRLDARSAQIVDLTGLEWATGLRVLQLDTNSISDISPLAGLTGLEQLSLGSNNISDISPLARLTGLKRLYLWLSNISDISPLARLTRLEELHLNVNDISDISPLAGLTGLEVLSLGYNYSISDISPLARLTRLRYLNLTSNNVTDLTPIAHLPWAGGDVLYAGNNPLRRASLDLLLRLADAGVAVD